MTPIDFAECTHVLGAPPGWDEKEYGPCKGLPVVMFEGGFESRWSLSWGERWRALLGRPVRLYAFCNGHPPVALQVP
jgi:hypothetical protein